MKMVRHFGQGGKFSLQLPPLNPPLYNYNVKNVTLQYDMNKCLYSILKQLITKYDLKIIFYDTFQNKLKQSCSVIHRNKRRHVTAKNYRENSNKYKRYENQFQSQINAQLQNLQTKSRTLKRLRSPLSVKFELNTNTLIQIQYIYQQYLEKQMVLTISKQNLLLIYIYLFEYYAIITYFTYLQNAILKEDLTKFMRDNVYNTNTLFKFKSIGTNSLASLTKTPQIICHKNIPNTHNIYMVLLQLVKVVEII
eukprot:TRINITY_DN313_c1_g1_i1.p2 TRINITY_DN313_c1_g1~~TRINITY_DN313_c1_g1_i1.p2  ORF type:complete len:251 (-),score=-23.85 TRINITY_DN313_c1_g1_i1:113-865(-)